MLVAFDSTGSVLVRASQGDVSVSAGLLHFTRHVSTRGDAVLMSGTATSEINGVRTLSQVIGSVCLACSSADEASQLPLALFRAQNVVLTLADKPSNVSAAFFVKHFDYLQQAFHAIAETSLMLPIGRLGWTPQQVPDLGSRIPDSITPMYPIFDVQPPSSSLPRHAEIAQLRSQVVSDPLAAGLGIAPSSTTAPATKGLTHIARTLRACNRLRNLVGASISAALPIPEQPSWEPIDWAAATAKASPPVPAPVPTLAPASTLPSSEHAPAIKSAVSSDKTAAAQNEDTSGLASAKPASPRPRSLHTPPSVSSTTLQASGMSETWLIARKPDGALNAKCQVALRDAVATAAEYDLCSSADSLVELQPTQQNSFWTTALPTLHTVEGAVIWPLVVSAAEMESGLSVSQKGVRDLMFKAVVVARRAAGKTPQSGFCDIQVKISHSFSADANASFIIDLPSLPDTWAFTVARTIGGPGAQVAADGFVVKASARGDAVTLVGKVLLTGIAAEGGALGSTRPSSSSSVLKIRVLCSTSAAAGAGQYPGQAEAVSKLSTRVLAQSLPSKKSHPALWQVAAHAGHGVSPLPPLECTTAVTVKFRGEV